MAVKSVDVKAPQISSMRVESAKLEKVASVKQEAVSKPAPDSGFGELKKKLVNTTGARHKPVAGFKGNPELAGFASSQLRVAQAGPVSGGTVKGFAPKIDADVGTLITALGTSSNKKNNADFAALGTAMKEGRWGDAAKLAKTAFDQANEEYIDENVPASTNKQTLKEDITSQLNFLAKMEAAQVKGDLPPTKEQLVKYFETLKGNPKEARAAFDQFAKAFNVHVAQERQDPSADVRYGGTEKNPLPPTKWDDVASRKPGGTTEYVGKRINDCEGYAYMAQELLGAAGFQLSHHLTANGGPAGAHAMAVFTHPDDPAGTVTITSNDGVFSGKKEKDVADKAFKYAGGTITKDNAYYQGATMKDSQKNAGAKSNPI
ncbi:MAG: hypothetical protein QM817_12315 [Archangium sp.]